MVIEPVYNSYTEKPERSLDAQEFL